MTDCNHQWGLVLLLSTKDNFRGPQWRFIPNYAESGVKGTNNTGNRGVVLSFQIALYDMIAVLVPGGLVLAAFFMSPWSSQFSVTSTPILVALLGIAWVIGHLVQAIAKNLVDVLGLWSAVQGGIGYVLCTRPADGPAERPVERGLAAIKWWFLSESKGARPVKQTWATLDWYARAAYLALRGTVTRLLWPIPRTPRYGPSVILEIREAVREYYGVDDVQAAEIYPRCFAVAQGRVRLYETFRASADFCRGAAFAFIILGISTWQWGVPEAVAQLPPNGDQLTAIALWYFSVVFFGRYLHYDYLAANSVIKSFLSITCRKYSSTISE
jgi:hypothetical protein